MMITLSSVKKHVSSIIFLLLNVNVLLYVVLTFAILVKDIKAFGSNMRKCLGAMLLLQNYTVMSVFTFTHSRWSSNKSFLFFLSEKAKQKPPRHVPKPP